MDTIEQDGVTTSTIALEMLDDELVSFKAVLGALGLQTVNYSDIRRYLGPFGVPYANLTLVRGPKGTLRIVRSLYTRSQLRDTEVILDDDDRHVLTVGRLHELQELGLAAIHYATGHVAGERARRLGGPALLQFDSEAARAGYSDGLAYLPYNGALDMCGL